MSDHERDIDLEAQERVRRMEAMSDEELMMLRDISANMGEIIVASLMLEQRSRAETDQS